MAKINLYPLRDRLWELPERIQKLYSSTRPIFDILIYIILFVVIFRSISAPYLLTYIKGSVNDTYSEGNVGQIETLNPLFVTGSDIDRAVFSLIYTKFIEIDDNGEPVSALVDEWEVSEKGKKIRFLLHDNYYWHDGEAVNADDVLFTFERSIAMSDLGFDTFGSSFTGLTVTADSDYSLLFEFDESIQNIFEVLSVYIVPEHIHSTVDVRESYDYGKDGNIVGSGMYEVVDFDDNSIELDDFKDDPFDPFIKKIHIDFFKNIEQLKVALKNGYIDSVAGVDPEEVSDILTEYKDFTLYTIHVDQRKKVMYFNLRDELFADPNVRYGLSHAVDKASMVEDFFFVAKKCKTTWPSSSWALDEELEDYYEFDKEIALEYFKDAGYEIPSDGEYLVNGVGDRLTFDLAYIMSSKNDLLAKEIKEQYNSVGVDVNLVDVTYSSLVNELLATRKFDVLLMEIEVNVDPDQYNLWHSTKVNYPDLNISGYENNRVDIMLERARSESNKQTRREDYYQIQKFIAQDAPVVVLYEPAYNLMTKSKFTNLGLEDISFPYERFRNINDWRIE